MLFIDQDIVSKSPVMDMALKTNNSPNSTAKKVFGTVQPCCNKTPRNSPK